MTIQDNLGTNTTEWTSADATGHQELARGTALGRYVIIEPIGSGGMGAIYRAYDPQLNRGVALKILSIKQEDSLAAERAKTRLIREAQALAQLSHPNVVAVHDVGSFEDDVFIAMELVEGKTLKEWMEQRQTPIHKGIQKSAEGRAAPQDTQAAVTDAQAASQAQTNNSAQTAPTGSATRGKKSYTETLKVMVAAGRGLAAAHKAGLVHRDFKPGNVIVGDDGRVRVLDFGLARAVSQEESQEEIAREVSEVAIGQSVENESQESKKALDLRAVSSSSTRNLLLSPITHAGGILGTPMYMAPEQHLGQKTDERTDIFGFCVVLYEALYGKRPYAAKTMGTLKNEVLLEQVSVPPASTDVPGWLWQIIQKGLRAKPKDRYPTLVSLLEELENDPEVNRRQQRLGRRRKLFVVLLAISTIVVPMGVWYAMRYRTVQLCKDAQAELKDVWHEAHKASIRQTFLDTDKSFALGTWERVEKTIDGYLAKWTQMRSEVCESRLVHATQSEELFDLRMSCLHKRMGELRALVKVFNRADAGVVERAVQASSSLTSIAVCADEEALRAPYPPPSTAQAKAKVIAIREQLGVVEALEKTGKYQEGLALTRKLAQQAEQIAYQPVRAEVLWQLGNLLDSVGEYKQAETALHDAARAAGVCGYGLLGAKAMVMLVYVVGYSQEQYKDGLLLGQAAEVMVGIARANDLLLSRLCNNLGLVYWKKLKYDKALEYYRKSLAIREKELGPDHPVVAHPLNNMGIIYWNKGEYDKALQYYRKSLAIMERVLGPEHPHVAHPLNNIGIALTSQGKYKQAAKSLSNALDIWQKALGFNHPLVAQSQNNIGIVYLRQGQYAQAHQVCSQFVGHSPEGSGTQPSRFGRVSKQHGLGALRARRF